MYVCGLRVCGWMVAVCSQCRRPRPPPPPNKCAAVSRVNHSPLSRGDTGGYCQIAGDLASALAAPFSPGEPFGGGIRSRRSWLLGGRLGGSARVESTAGADLAGCLACSGPSGAAPRRPPIYIYSTRVVSLAARPPCSVRVGSRVFWGPGRRTGATRRERSGVLLGSSSGL